MDSVGKKAAVVVKAALQIVGAHLTDEEMMNYIYDEEALSRKQRERVEVHMGGCERCAQEMWEFYEARKAVESKPEWLAAAKLDFIKKKIKPKPIVEMLKDTMDSIFYIFEVPALGMVFKGASSQTPPEVLVDRNLRLSGTTDTIRLRIVKMHDLNILFDSQCIKLVGKRIKIKLDKSDNPEKECTLAPGDKNIKSVSGKITFHQSEIKPADRVILVSPSFDDLAEVGEG